MKLTRHPDAQSFISTTEQFLYRDEVVNSIMLGVSNTLQKDPGHYGTVPWFASVEDGGKTLAAAMRTPPHNLLVSPGPDEAMELLVADALQAMSSIPGLYGPWDSSLAAAGSVGRISARKVRKKSADRVHCAGVVANTAPAPGRLREITGDEVPLFCGWLESFGKEVRVLVSGTEAIRARMEHHQAWVWDDGGPVCMASWGRETKNTGCIYGVYTPPDKRGRGYASNLVAGISRHLLSMGKSRCVLFTDLANPVSNSIYAKIGYTPVCDFDEYGFE